MITTEIRFGKLLNQTSINMIILSSTLAIGLGLISCESFAPRSIVDYRLSPLAKASSQVGQTTGPLFASVANSTLGTLHQETSVAAVPKVAQRWRKSTKQLATLGPSSSNREMIEKVRHG